MSERFPTWLPTFYALASALLLAGCFASDEPKLALTTAVPVAGEGGRFAVFDRKLDGSFEKADNVYALKLRPDGAYDVTDKIGNTELVSFHPLSNGFHVVQSKTKMEWIYALARIAGNEALLYAPLCDAQDKAKLERLGAAPRGPDTCMIDRVNDPVGLFTALQLGEPESKMVRE